MTPTKAGRVGETCPITPSHAPISPFGPITPARYTSPKNFNHQTSLLRLVKIWGRGGTRILAQPQQAPSYYLYRWAFGGEGRPVVRRSSGTAVGGEAQVER